MLKKFIIAIVSFVVIVLVLALTRPTHYEIYRETVIASSAEDIFPWLNNSEKMNEWMPWAERDPKMKMTFSGPSEGVGAVSSWTSEGSMGEGSATISESLPSQKVVTKLEYFKPFQMSQTAEMSLTPQEGKTLVRWSVRGEYKFAQRVACVFMNMDKLVGKSFEKGLQKLKTKVEEKK